MILSVLLRNLSYKVIQGTPDVEIASLVYDSRKMKKGAVFVCISGARFDGHDHILEAVQKGAVAVVIEKRIDVPEGITAIEVKDTRIALAFLSAAYFNNPAEKLTTIGITGTKGKTTTAYMVYSILQNAGIKTGLIGTIETIIGALKIPSNNTTPESYLLQEYFSKMLEEGCSCVVMEVSSQSLKLNRVAGFTFDYGVFTNMESDHIGPDEHASFEEYMACKGLLFKNCRIGIVNADDKYTEIVLKGHTCGLETYGVAKEADLYADNIDLHSRLGSLGVTYDVKGLMNFGVQVDIPGKFSVYNSLTAIAICRHLQIDETTIQKALSEVKVKGRVEPVKISEKFTLMIDYAHNAMSLNSLLSTLKEYHPKRLVCLFGCGGNRSKDRRYEMGEISALLSDISIITSDNPRYEEPGAIIDDILIGIRKGFEKADNQLAERSTTVEKQDPLGFRVDFTIYASGRNESGQSFIAICDRKTAIAYAIRYAKQGDVIILAGKGHEDYQEICGVKYSLDERVLIREILAEMSEQEKAAHGLFFDVHTTT